MKPQVHLLSVSGVLRYDGGCICSTSGALCARLFTKGAAEILLDSCSMRVAEDSSVTYLSDEDKQQILQSFAREGSLR